MKLETFLALSKLFIFTMVGGLVPMGTALQQWIDTGEWPPAINWVGIWIGFGIGAGNAYVSYISTSFANWKSQRTAKPAPLPEPPPINK